MKVAGGKKYTAQELAVQFGCGVKTIHNHANVLFGKAENGVKREFDEAQTTAILERLKTVNNNQHDLVSSLQGTETTMSRELRLAMLYKETALLERELRLETEATLSETKHALADEVMDHRGTKRLLTEQIISARKTRITHTEYR